MTMTMKPIKLVLFPSTMTMMMPMKLVQSSGDSNVHMLGLPTPESTVFCAVCQDKLFCTISCPVNRPNDACLNPTKNVAREVTFFGGC